MWTIPTAPVISSTGNVYITSPSLVGANKVFVHEATRQTANIQVTQDAFQVRDQAEVIIQSITQTYFQEHILNFLPYEYRRKDAQDLSEGGSDGNLAQYMQVFAITLDEIKQAIDEFLLLIDIDHCPPRYLKTIADVLNYPLEDTDTTKEKREQLKTAISWYKSKGSRRAFEAILYAFGFYATFVPLWTEDYETFSETIPGVAKGNDPPNDHPLLIENGGTWYRSPHFGIYLEGIIEDKHAFISWPDGVDPALVATYEARAAEVGYHQAFYDLLDDMIDAGVNLRYHFDADDFNYIWRRLEFVRPIFAVLDWLGFQIWMADKVPDPTESEPMTVNPYTSEKGWYLGYCDLDDIQYTRLDERLLGINPLAVTSPLSAPSPGVTSIVDEVIHSVTAPNTKSAYGTFANQWIFSGSTIELTILDGGSNVVTVTDNGEGVFRDEDWSLFGFIDYLTGVWSLSIGIGEFEDGTTITADYDYTTGVPPCDRSGVIPRGSAALPFPHLRDPQEGYCHPPEDLEIDLYYEADDPYQLPLTRDGMGLYPPTGPITYIDNSDFPSRGYFDGTDPSTVTAVTRQYGYVERALSMFQIEENPEDPSDFWNLDTSLWEDNDFFWGIWLTLFKDTFSNFSPLGHTVPIYEIDNDPVKTVTTDVFEKVTIISEASPGSSDYTIGTNDLNVSIDLNSGATLGYFGAYLAVDDSTNNALIFYSLSGSSDIEIQLLDGGVPDQIFTIEGVLSASSSTTMVYELDRINKRAYFTIGGESILFNGLNYINISTFLDNANELSLLFPGDSDFSNLEVNDLGLGPRNLGYGNRLLAQSKAPGSSVSLTSGSGARIAHAVFTPDSSLSRQDFYVTYKDGSNYLDIWHNNGSSSLVILERLGGTITTVATYTNIFTADTAIAIRVEIETSGNVRVFADNVELTGGGVSVDAELATYTLTNTNNSGTSEINKIRVYEHEKQDIISCLGWSATPSYGVHGLWYTKDGSPILESGDLAYFKYETLGGTACVGTDSNTSGLAGTPFIWSAGNSFLINRPGIDPNVGSLSYGQEHDLFIMQIDGLSLMGFIDGSELDSSWVDAHYSTRVYPCISNYNVAFNLSELGARKITSLQDNSFRSTLVNDATPSDGEEFTFDSRSGSIDISYTYTRSNPLAALSSIFLKKSDDTTLFQFSPDGSTSADFSANQAQPLSTLVSGSGMCPAGSVVAIRILIEDDGTFYLYADGVLIGTATADSTSYNDIGKLTVSIGAGENITDLVVKPLNLGVASDRVVLPTNANSLTTAEDCWVILENVQVPPSGQDDMCIGGDQSSGVSLRLVVTSAGTVKVWAYVDGSYSAELLSSASSAISSGNILTLLRRDDDVYAWVDGSLIGSGSNAAGSCDASTFPLKWQTQNPPDWVEEIYTIPVPVDLQEIS